MYAMNCKEKRTNFRFSFRQNAKKGENCIVYATLFLFVPFSS